MTERFTVTQDPTMSECFRACISTIFQVPVDELPLMGADSPVADHEDLGMIQDQQLRAWLRERGMDYLSLNAKGDGRYLPWGLCIASGPTERGTHHAVVWDAGFWLDPRRDEDTQSDGHMVHDPHPSRAGLEDITRFLCFVVLDPPNVKAGAFQGEP